MHHTTSVAKQQPKTEPHPQGNRNLTPPDKLGELLARALAVWDKTRAKQQGGKP